MIWKSRKEQRIRILLPISVCVEVFIHIALFLHSATRSKICTQTYYHRKWTAIHWYFLQILFKKQNMNENVKGNRKFRVRCLSSLDNDTNMYVVFIMIYATMVVVEAHIKLTHVLHPINTSNGPTTYRKIKNYDNDQFWTHRW